MLAGLCTGQHKSKKDKREARKASRRQGDPGGDANSQGLYRPVTAEELAAARARPADAPAAPRRRLPQQDQQDLRPSEQEPVSASQQADRAVSAQQPSLIQLPDASRGVQDEQLPAESGQGQQGDEAAEGSEGDTGSQVSEPRGLQASASTVSLPDTLPVPRAAAASEAAVLCACHISSGSPRSPPGTAKRRRLHSHIKAALCRAGAWLQACAHHDEYSGTRNQACPNSVPVFTSHSRSRFHGVTCRRAMSRRRWQPYCRRRTLRCCLRLKGTGWVCWMP